MRPVFSLTERQLLERGRYRPPPTFTLGDCVQWVEPPPRTLMERLRGWLR